jgi:hypothetical protein
VSNASFDFQKNWKTGENFERGEEYQAFKNEFALRMIARVEEYIPALSGQYY